MIKFNKPTNLNGTELITEIKNAGIEVIGVPMLDEYGDLWLDIDSADEATVTAIVAAHNGTTIAPEPTIEDKLASVGLSINELKTVLSE